MVFQHSPGKIVKPSRRNSKYHSIANAVRFLPFQTKSQQLNLRCHQYWNWSPKEFREIWFILFWIFIWILHGGVQYVYTSPSLMRGFIWLGFVFMWRKVKCLWKYKELVRIDDITSEIFVFAVNKVARKEKWSRPGSFVVFRCFLLVTHYLGLFMWIWVNIALINA